MNLSTTDKKKYFVYLLSSLMFGSGVILMPDIINQITITYVSIIGAFLGIDIATTLKTTNKLPEGEYKNIKEDRYVITFITTAILFGLTMLMKKKFGIDMESGSTLLAGTLFFIATAYISILEGNKLLTGIKSEEK